MNRSDIISRLDPRVATALSGVEAASGLQVEFKPLTNSDVVAQYWFDPHTNIPTVSLRSDWQDVDVAHEIMHMRLELIEGFSVLAWRQGVRQTAAIESAFGRVRGYVDDEVVHSCLAQQAFTLDGEVLKSQLFDGIYTKVPSYLSKMRPRPNDGMTHLDSIGYGELCRSSFLVQAELVRANYISVLSDSHRKKLLRFIDAFRTHRSPEAKKADEVLMLFRTNDVNTVLGHKRILESWAQIEGLNSFVGASTYARSGTFYVLPWPCESRPE